MIMFSFFSFKKKSSRYSKKVNDSYTCCTCGDNTKATRFKCSRDVQGSRNVFIKITLR